MTEAILHLTAWKYERSRIEEEQDENISAVKELTYDEILEQPEKSVLCI